MNRKPLSQSFYRRDAAVVARALLGKRIIRCHRGRELVGRIVETEAYYGTQDPASRAYSGKQTPLNAPMWGPPGTVMVYMVHSNWLFNIVTGKKGESSAVLIRAVEPVEELEFMLRKRRARNPSIRRVRDIASGPGKFTQAFAIGKTLNWESVLTMDGVWVTHGPKEEVVIASTQRIGVTRDLAEPLRFIIDGDPYVSK